MKRIKIFLTLLIILYSCYSCDKDSSTLDLATQVEGIYTGHWTVYGRSFKGSCEVIYNTKTTVNFILVTEGSFDTTITKIKISNGKNGEIEFFLADSNGELKGSFINDAMSFTIDDGKKSVLFTGVR